MTTIDLLRRLFQHKAWVNRSLLESAQQLNDEQLQTTFPIGQGSIWKSLTHLAGADFVWLEALLGNPRPLMPGDVEGRLPGNQQGEGAFTTIGELARFWQETDQRWDQYLVRLSEDQLDDPVVKFSTSSGGGKQHSTRKCDVLLHLCTHAQYTVAQAVNMLKQLGVERLPETMLITLARQEASDIAH